MPNTVHVAGATSKIITVRAAYLSTGAPRTDLLFNTPTIAAAYQRDGAVMVPITLVAGTIGTWISGGFIYAGKGEYELGAPNNAFLTGVDGVRFKLDGVTDTWFEIVRVEIVGINPRLATPPDVNMSTAAGQTVIAAGSVTLPSSVAGVGAAMTLTSGERTAVAGAVETAILNEGDGSLVLQAIIDKINATDTNLAGLTLGAIAAAVRDVAIAGAAASSLGAAIAALPTATANADALLARSQKGGSNTGPSVAQALAGGLLLFAIDPLTGAASILHGDGTVAYTRTIARSPVDAVIGAA